MRLILSATLLSLALPAAAESRWELGIGISGISFDDYLGSDERNNWVLPFPYVSYRSDWLDVSREQVTGKIFTSDRVKFTVSLNGSLPIDSNNNKARQGMPDLDPTGEIGPALQFTLFDDRERHDRLTLELPVRASFASDFKHVKHIGWVASPNLYYERDFALQGGPLTVDASFGPVFGDGDYHQYFYGVDPRFATAERPAFEADAGFGGWRLSLGVSHTRGNFWYGAFVRYFDLADAQFADSPLVKQDYSVIGGVAVAWILARSGEHH
ncbi:MAG: MipA/OmpV family protein [Gammaproteobacteria bacterium]